MSQSVPRTHAAHRATEPRASLAMRTLAEARQHLQQPGTLATLAVASLACGISGPFATDTILDLGPRILFWTVMVVVTYAVGTMASELVWLAWGRTLLPVPALVLAALGPGLAAPPVVLGLNTIMLGTPYPFDGLGAFMASLVLVCGAVGILGHLATRGIPPAWIEPWAAEECAHTAGQSADVAPDRTEPAARLMERLPPQARAPLVSLSGEDHYTLVRTLAGETRLLMRLSDAIALAGDIPGLRVHRSHWVARDQVRGVCNDGGRLVLAMAQGTDIPVSRSNVAVLRSAGLADR